MTNCEEVRSWLSNTYNIQVSDAWLGACLEWILVENEGRALPAADLQSQVFDQWLLSDLAEIGEPVLPPEVSTAQKMDLISNYPLQITSCIDAGFPLYGQKQKLLGSDNPNELVTADTSKPFQFAWEPKPSQMLVLELTDGHTNVRGLEVERIPGLHTQLPSGVKVLVSGTVVSRRGMLLLSGPHLQLLGGEVDSLADNTPLVNLERAMERNRAEEGGHDKKEFSGKFLMRGDKKKLQQQSSSNKWNRNSSSSSASTSQQFGKQFQPGPSQVKSFKSSVVKAEVKKEENLKHDEWDDDLDYAEIFNDDIDLDMMDDDFDSPSVTTVSSAITNAKKQKMSINEDVKSNLKPELSTSLKPESPVLLDDDMFEDDFEAELAVMNSLEGEDFSSSRSTNGLPWSRKTTNNSTPVSRNASTLSHTDKDVKKLKRPSVNAAVSSSAISTHKTSPNQAVFKSSQTKQIDSVASESSRCNPQFIKNNNQYSRDGQSVFDTKKSMKSPKQCKLSDMFGAKNSSSSSRNNSPILSQDDTRLSTISPPSTPSNIFPIFGKREISASQQKPVTPKAVVQPFRNDCFKYEIEDSPFSYLSKLSSLPAGSTMIVKAYISTLTNKLNSCNGERWYLSCRINDGTDTVDVDLHNNVLTELIGFSAPDSMVMKQRMRTDPQIKEILMEGMSGCQEKLSNTSCLMKLEVPVRTVQTASSDSPRPVLTKLIHLSQEHIAIMMQKLYKR